MDVRLINSIIAALFNVLPQLGFKNVVRGKVFTKEQFVDSLGFLVNIGLTSQTTGNIVFNMTEEVAKSLSAVMMQGAPVEKLDDLAQSAICEMINMVISDAVNSFNKSELTVQLEPPAGEVSNSKFRICNRKYIGFEMGVDNLMIEIGIGLN